MDGVVDFMRDANGILIFLAASALAYHVFFGQGTPEGVLGILGIFVVVKLFQGWRQFKKRQKRS